MSASFYNSNGVADLNLISLENLVDESRIFKNLTDIYENET